MPATCLFKRSVWAWREGCICRHAFIFLEPMLFSILIVEIPNQHQGHSELFHPELSLEALLSGNCYVPLCCVQVVGPKLKDFPSQQGRCVLQAVYLKYATSTLHLFLCHTLIKETCAILVCLLLNIDLGWQLNFNNNQYLPIKNRTFSSFFHSFCYSVSPELKIFSSLNCVLHYLLIWLMPNILID